MRLATYQLMVLQHYHRQGVLVGGVSTGGAVGAVEGGADLTTTEATEITLMIGDN